MFWPLSSQIKLWWKFKPLDKINWIAYASCMYQVNWKLAPTKFIRLAKRLQLVHIIAGDIAGRVYPEQGDDEAYQQSIDDIVQNEASEESLSHAYGPVYQAWYTYLDSLKMQTSLWDYLLMSNSKEALSRKLPIPK